ncbi:hypothetical protein C353_06725 [Cryptococcus neoformans AD1-83a]|nr:hypothetical protein C353_06725 [Cryptococcus neoformans var. grubii AD1-83a]
MLDGVDGLVTHHTKAALKATAQVQVAPQAPKTYLPQQLEWLDPAKRLPLGDTGKATRAFLGSINACFSCQKTGHHRLICPTRPPSSPSQHSSSAPAANLISLADDDSPNAPDIFLVDPVADQLAGWRHCPSRVIDSGAGINVIDQEYAAQLGLRGTPVPLVGTKMADNQAGPVIEQEYLVDVSIGETIYAATPFYAMPLGLKYRLILGLPFCRQHRLFDGAIRLNKLLLDDPASQLQP